VWSGLRLDRQRSEARTSRREDQHGASHQLALGGVHIGEKEPDLGLGPTWRLTQQHDAWPGMAPESQKLAEIRVGRDEHPVFSRCGRHDPSVFDAEQAPLSNMDGVVARLTQKVSDALR
jgi:hypothetical protein